MASVLPRAANRDNGTNYCSVEIANLKDTLPEEWFEGCERGYITILEASIRGISQQMFFCASHPVQDHVKGIADLAVA